MCNYLLSTSGVSHYTKKYTSPSHHSCIILCLMTISSFRLMAAGAPGDSLSWTIMPLFSLPGFF